MSSDEYNIYDIIQETTKESKFFSLDRFGHALLDQFGGEYGLAQKALQEFEAAEPGSTTRKMILDMVCKVIERIKPDENQLEDLDDEVIEQEIRSLLDGIIANRNKKRGKSP